MTTIIRPSADPKVESILQEFNLRYELLEAVELSTIADEPAQQARAIVHRAIPENVEKYYEQMKAGAQFPPIVLREPRILLDGNTRRAAASKLGMQYFPAYVVHDITTGDMARALSGAINQTNGQPLTVEEAQEIAVEMMYGELRFSVQSVARYVGRSATQINRWRKQSDVKRHAERLGLDEQIGMISATQREKLADVQHDEPFRRLVEVVAGSKPPNAELTAVVKDVAAATSEASEIEVVDAAAQMWRPTGPAARVVRNRKAQQARMAAGQLLKMRPADVFDPERAVDDRIMWERLRDQADDVLRSFIAHGVK